MPILVSGFQPIRRAHLLPLFNSLSGRHDHLCSRLSQKSGTHSVAILPFTPTICQFNKPLSLPSLYLKSLLSECCPRPPTAATNHHSHSGFISSQLGHRSSLWTGYTAAGIAPFLAVPCVALEGFPSCKLIKSFPLKSFSGSYCLGDRALLCHNQSPTPLSELSHYYF